MIKKITIIAGLLLGIAGLLGLAAPNFTGLGLSASQGIVYFASGGLALFFGLCAPPRESRMFALILGGFYGFLGVVGLGLGEPGLTMIPGRLVFETPDHIFHLSLGVVVLAVALSGGIASPIRAHGTNR